MGKGEEGVFGSSPPFVLISAVELVRTEKGLVEGRDLNYGMAEIHNPSHSEYPLFIHLLFNRLSLDLIKTTHSIYKTLKPTLFPNPISPSYTSLLPHFSAILLITCTIFKILHKTSS